MRAGILGVVAVGMIAFGSLSVTGQVIDQGTLDALKAEVLELRQRLDEASSTLESGKAIVNDQKRIIDEAPQIAQDMIDDLEGLVEEFRVGSEVHSGIQEAKEDLGRRIDEWRESDSEIRREAADDLRKELDRLEATDGQRDQYVGKAMAEIRRLNAQKADLEAIIVVGAYQTLVDEYAQMVDGFAVAVDSATQLNDQISGSVDPQAVPNP